MAKINAIVRFATPTIKFVFSTLDTSQIEDARLIIKQRKEVVVSMDFADAAVSSGCIEWTVPQEETGKLKEFESAEVYCDWKTFSGTRGRSKMTVFDVEPTGYEDVM